MDARDLAAAALSLLLAGGLVHHGASTMTFYCADEDGEFEGDMEAHRRVFKHQVYEGKMI